MIDLFFAAGIPFVVYLIFVNTPSLEDYANIVFWVFIACLIVFVITVIIQAILAIKNTVSKSKGN